MENEVINPDKMKRGDFLRTLGLSTSALMAFYCMGTLTSCSNGDDPAPSNNNNNNPGTGTVGFAGNAEASKGKVDFTLDLTSSTYSTLKTQGNYTKIGDVLIANAKSGRYIAVAKTCTHEGGGLDYRSNSDDLLCNNHGGQFNTDGSVKLAPPTNALKVYKTELTNNNNTLRITE
ncbi:hypothetical protein GCM10023189_54970 [Nibrella saemangeumensis]|uniref:Rieske domain-containing protein n=1 Tax=Nibrella saemangeumensis TaxID=1084526 RepID=A0ABP8NKM8_9BACT